MDLLTSYALIHKPISIIHKSPEHQVSLFEPAVFSLVVPWQRLLTVEVLQLHALKPSVRRLPYRTDLVTPIVSKITPRYGPCRNTPFPTVSQLLRVDSLLWERVNRAAAQKRRWHIRPPPGRHIVTTLHATVFHKATSYCMGAVKALFGILIQHTFSVSFIMSLLKKH
jgi:hypothetical protein